MLTVKLLNDQATLNNFLYLGTKEYIPNKAFTIKFQLFDSENNVRIMSGSAATCSVVFQKSDGTELTKSASFLFSPDDRSMWKVALTNSEANDIIGSNFLINLDVLGDATDLRSGMANNMLIKITFDGEC